MSDVSEYLDHNKIRIIVCLVVLALGSYTTKALHNRRMRDNPWLITLFITVVAVVGMWFTLAGTVTGVSEDAEGERPVKRALTEYDKMIGLNRGLLPIVAPFCSPTMLVGRLFKTIKFGDLPDSQGAFSKRVLGDLIVPVIHKPPRVPTKRSFFQKNKSRLVTTGTSTATTATGAYSQRERRNVMCACVLLMIILAVGLWFLVGEDTEDNEDEL